MRLLSAKYRPEEQKAFFYHLAYSILEGVILGVLALNEFVLIKSLKGSNLQVGVLFQVSMLVFLFLVVINELIRRYRNKPALLRWTGILTRAPLFLLIFFPADAGTAGNATLYHALFLGLFFVYYFGNTVIYPLINLFLKKVYAHSHFGKLYGWATSVNKVVMLVATFFYGLLLDRDPSAYRYVFPFVAALGVLSVWLLSLIPFSEESADIRLPAGKAMWRSVLRMREILLGNKAYFHFEMGFMLYGFAFMITTTVITIFLERALHLNYSSIAFYKNAYNLLAIVLLPYTGKLLGKLDPRKFAIITFSALAFYILFMMLTGWFPVYVSFWGIRLYLMLGIAYLFYGVFASTMALLWFIGSAYFCSPEEAGDYQSVHLSLTAGRALFAPLLGVFFYESFGFSVTFMIAIGSLLAAVWLMHWSEKRDRQTVTKA
ncbi:MAG: hypothetical protein Kow00127_25610 [Bacteroidales bacterium]